MANLGGAFPAGYRKEQLRRQLKTGSVIKLKERMDDGVVKEKRYVVLHADANTVCCVINSEINPFIARNPALKRAQVPMPASDHDFMDHDSHIDCSQLKTFTTAHVLDELANQPSWMLGKITIAIRDEIVSRLKISSTISSAKSSELIVSLSRIV